MSKLKLDDGAKRMYTASQHSLKKCQSELQRLYDDVQNSVEAVRRGNPAKMQTSTHADFLEEWNSHARQREHLPLSLELISIRFAEERRVAIEYRCPHGPTSADSPRYLLLMAGFSIEQLVLSMAFHYRDAIEHNGTLAGIVPFIGGDAWNQVEGDLIKTLPLAIDEPHATAIADLLQSAVDVTPGDPALVFKRVLEWSRKNPAAAVALDVTGGQKPMDTGGTYAAMYLGARAYYLDFDDYDIAHRRPFPDSLKYEQLALPSAVFSHDTRKAVVELFRHRRFQTAYDRLTELTSEMNAPDVQKYFEPSDKDDVRNSSNAVEACNAWMSGNYCHESMANDRLYGTFCAFEQKGPNEQTGPKTLLNSMLETFGNHDSDKSRDLFYYLQDEYWRLRTMLYLGDEAKADRHCADLQEASEMIREVVVGSCALAEVAIDAVFHLPFVEVKVAKLRHIRIEYGDSRAAEDTITSESHLLKQNEHVLSGIVTGMKVPTHRFPLSSTQPKSDCIRGKKGIFRLFLPPDKILTAIPSGCDVLDRVLRDEVIGTSRVGPSQKRIEVDAVVKSTQVLDVDNLTWKTNWGEFGKNEEHNPDNWMANRNAIAHMRATATTAQLDIARNAIEFYLPRFLGMLAILSGGNRELPITDEAAWEAGCEAIASPCGPWHQPDKNETQLRRWLRLPM